MTLVAGVDSSTQSCKVVVVDADTGVVVREGRAPHPDGTEVPPEAWWTAFEAASAAADGLTLTPDGTKMIVGCGPKTRTATEAEALILKLPGK